MTAITGNTYPVRELLKALGAKWNPNAKVWMVPDNKAEEARRIVTSSTSEPSKSEPFRHTKCTICGHVPRNRWDKIYRSGECRGCYEERKMGY